MRGIRVALGILVIATGSVIAADEAATIPAPQPPRPVSPQAAAPASPEQKLLREKLAQRDALQREIEDLTQATGTPQQIVVRVQMMEVNLTQLKKLGMDFEGNDPLRSGGSSPTYTAPANAGDESATDLERDAISESPSAREQALRNFLRTLVQNGIAKTIADPILVTTSGRPASFSVGGEFPLPAAPGSAGAVEYRRFGTELNVIAVPLGNNKVRLDVRPRVSDVDLANSITVNGQKVPSVRVQQCDTSCESAFGETVQLSGLVTKRTMARRDEKGTTNETMDVGLWVFVTAELGATMNATDAAASQAIAPRPVVGGSRFGTRPTTAR